MTAHPSEEGERPLVPNPLVRLFASADLRSLAVVRMVLGLLLVCDLVPRIAQVDAFYSNDGVLTNHYALFRPLAPYQFSFYVAASSTRDVTVVFLLTLVVYLLFAAGYRTRLFHILSFVCVTSLHARNLLVELPSDAVLHVGLAWSLFLPLGARFSIDSLRKSLSERREKSPEALNERPARPFTFSSVAVLGMVLQLSAMHVAAAMRQSGPTWSDGTALYYALHHNYWATAGGAWLGRSVSLDTLKLLTIAYRNTQIALGLLMLVPITLVRRVTIVLLVLFHAVSRALFDVGPYDLAVLAAVPLLLSTRDWIAMRAWYARRKRELVVYFDADCGICLMICRWLVRFDGLGRLTFAANASDAAPPEVKAAAAETVVVRDEKAGRTFTKSRALAAVLASLPFGGFASLILRAPGIAQLADRGYDLVAKNRAAISVWLGFQACGVPRAPSAVPVRRASTGGAFSRGFVLAREVAATGFLVLCSAALWQGTLPEAKAPNLAEPVFAALSYPRIFQKWGLFVPDPPKELGLFVVDAWNGRGQRFDPLTGAPPRESPDRDLQGEAPVRPSPLMGAYFTSVSQPAHAIYLDGLRDYVTRIGDERPPSDRPTAYTVSWLEAPIALPDGAPPTPTPSHLVTRRRLTARP
ncbi:MAG TPA: DCC1-like thiol-disulfide oxidoreductase family protein [Polyangiaceae bacterium]|nr:DCC1-like thiol-disulfide oxidoreductase family protein [Polyangiaceae bacterium]